MPEQVTCGNPQEMTSRIEALCGLRSKEELISFMQKFYKSNANYSNPMRTAINLPSTINGDDNISIKSVGSGPKCFHPNTFFLCFRGGLNEYHPARTLAPGDIVDQCVRVKACQMHEAKAREVVELKTPTSRLFVTSDHRISVTSDHRMIDKKAKDVSPGDIVNLNSGPQEVFQVKRSWVTRCSKHVRYIEGH